MNEIKSLIDDDIKENIDHSAICVKFAMMSKQIENKDKEIERLNKLISQRENKWEKWTTEKTILSTKVSDYLCKYQNIKREYTKQIKISTDRKNEIERLNNKLELISKIVEREFPPNEFITYKIKKILKGADKE